ncbi:MAG TPA: hypothetical protein VEN79_01820 [Terriglobia bacterium]|nr:hypothetical protein [Terriglobia bacterium]
MGQTEDVLDDRHVLTIDEISNLTLDGGKPAETLMNVVALIARRFRTDVCCVYLLELIESTWCWRQPWASVPSVLALCAWPHMKVWWGW